MHRDRKPRHARPCPQRDEAKAAVKIKQPGRRAKQRADVSRMAPVEFAGLQDLHCRGGKDPGVERHA